MVDSADVSVIDRASLALPAALPAPCWVTLSRRAEAAPMVLADPYTALEAWCDARSVSRPQQPQHPA